MALIAFINRRDDERPLLKFGACAVVAAALLTPPAMAQSIEDFRQMSIEDLAEVNVSSVSKTDQPLSDAPAAIYVISREDIIRSGAISLPEMLRLAPNLQVYQTSPAEWVVTARGLNGNRAAQSYSNKLLVLVDGRPAYTPLFSGVYWDMPQVVADDVDRIEVISGPGATLWGANAVNGVINVITRRSTEGSGLSADLRAGPERRAATLSVAGRLGENASYRIHGKYLEDEEFFTLSGAGAGDAWHRLGGGFRIDWTPNDLDLVTVQGDIINGSADRGLTQAEDFSGRNLTLRWNHRLGTGELQAQAFYDRISRDSRATGGGKFYVDTFDAQVQHNFAVGERHQVVWGGGARIARYDIEGTDAFFFDPADGELFIANLFVQDSFSLTPELTFTGGLKIEHLPYAGTSLLPELRVAWKPEPSLLVWASLARAIRSPTPFDVDVEERAGPISLSGNPDFRTEKLTSLELGMRVQPAATFSLSATLFYHRYDDLRSIEITTGPGLLPLGWGNGLEGETYGIETWADLRVAPWWTLAGGLTLIERDFAFKPESSGLLGIGQLGNDPPYWVTIRSSMNPITDVTLDLDFRAVGALRDANIPAYQELGGRLAWHATPGLALTVTGTNLLHRRHQEYPGADVIPRRILGGVDLSF